jgi:hypothetical protein
MNFKWDWLTAGCRNDETGEEYLINPSYPLGKPEELENVDVEKKLNVI